MQDLLIVHVLEAEHYAVDAVLAEGLRELKSVFDGRGERATAHVLEDRVDATIPVKHLLTIDNILAVHSHDQTHFIYDILSLLRLILCGQFKCEDESVGDSACLPDGTLPAVRNFVDDIIVVARVFILDLTCLVPQVSLNLEEGPDIISLVKLITEQIFDTYLRVASLIFLAESFHFHTKTSVLGEALPPDLIVFIYPHLHSEVELTVLSMSHDHGVHINFLTLIEVVDWFLGICCCLLL